jgi:hypothetical protein
MAKVYITVSVEVPECDYDGACAVLDDCTLEVVTSDGKTLDTSIAEYSETSPN